MADGFKIAEAFVEIKAKDETDADVTKLKAKLNALKGTAKVDADIKAAETKLAQLQAKLDELKSKPASAKVDADITEAEAKIDELKAKLDTLKDKKVTVEVDVDRGLSSLAKLDASNLKSIGIFGAVVAAAVGVGAAVGALPASIASVAGMGTVLVASFKGVGEAMDAYHDDMVKNGEAGEKFNGVMAQLPKPTQDFVRQLIAAGPAVKNLREAVGASFLPGVTSFLKDSIGLFPIFQGFLVKTGTMMGDTAKKMGELFKTDKFKQDLQTLLDSSQPISTAIMKLFSDMTTKLVSFGAQMKPASDGFATFINDVNTGLTGTDGFFDKLAPHADSFKQIWEGLGKIMKVLLPIIGDLAGQIADSLGPALEKIGDWMTNHKEATENIVKALGILFVTLKAAGLVANVTKWVTGVMGLFDKLGASATKNKGLVDGLTGGGKGGAGATTMKGAAKAKGPGIGVGLLGTGLVAEGIMQAGQSEGSPGWLKSITKPLDKDDPSMLNWNNWFKSNPGGGAATDGTLGASKNGTGGGAGESTDILAKIKEAWEKVKQFFTTTIPQAFTSLKATLGEKWTLVTTFFTQTIPQAFTDLKTKITEKWTQVTTLFTTTIPAAWDAFKTMLSTKWTAITTFFTTTVPQAWDAFKTMLAEKWKVVTDFFTTTIPQAWDAFKTMLSDKWTQITTFFTTTVPEAWDAFKTMLVDKWKTITDWFTTDVPNFFGTLLDKLKSAWSSITSWVSSLNPFSSSSSSSGGAPAGQANGNLLTPMASGGALSPMSGSSATVVPPNTWRVIGDNMTHPELFAPLDGSQRSLNLIKQGAAAYGQAMVPLNAIGFANGGIAGGAPGGTTGGISATGTTAGGAPIGSSGGSGDMLNAILAAWNQGVVPVFTKLIPQFLKTNAPAAINLGWQGIKDLLTKQLPAYLKTTAQPAMTQAFDKVQALMGTTFPGQLTNNAVPALSGAGAKATDVLSKTMPDSLNAAQQSLSTAGTAATDVPGKDMPTALDTAQQALSTSGTKVTDEVGKTLPDGINQAATSLQTACQSVVSALQSLVQQIQQLAQQAQSAASSAQSSSGGSSGLLPTGPGGGLSTPNTGGLFASGGIASLTPMSGDKATVVQPDTWRIVGDNMRHPELFAPLDGSARSLSLINMAAGLFGQKLVPANSTASANGSVQSNSAVSTQKGRQSAQQRPGMGPVNIHINQKSASPAETGRMVALALRTVC